MKRKIIRIDEGKCDGCGLCAKGCPEGAIQIIDGKARLVSAVYCDGLGACVGECPPGAITVEEREAEPYDEVKALENIIPQGRNTVLAHLRHLQQHGQKQYLAQAFDHLKKKAMPVSERELAPKAHAGGCPGASSQLRQWPIQLHLLSPDAPFFEGADLLVAADCVPFAHGGFHESLLKGKALIILCPKLDQSNDEYIEKLAEIFSSHDIRSVTVAHMEVPCCFGTVAVVQEALSRSGKMIPLQRVVLSLHGEIA